MAAAAPFEFDAHVALLTIWLDHRREIGERIERTLLNVQGKETSRRRDRPFFERAFAACLFAHPAVPRELAGLAGQLQASHVSDGFEPERRDRFATELDPLELLVRAYEHWDQHRWPGSSGRLAYAHTLFVVFVIRQLEWMSLRVWDGGLPRASERLGVVQRLLDRLNAAPSPVVFVRDAAWLIQTAQGPLTPHPEPYFAVANHIASSFSAATRARIHAAGAVLTAGHLRSQLRYGTWRTGRSIEHPESVAFARNTNAMDHALLVRDLVGVLDAYGAAVSRGDVEARARLADAVLQGVSVDPELYLVRQDLLAVYTSIEELHLEDGPDGVRLSAEGQTARRAAARCAALLSTHAPALRHDLALVNPDGRPYSPLGIVYGFVSDVLANVAMEVLVGRRGPIGSVGSAGSIETMFDSGGDLAASRARAEGWAALPKRAGERDHFEHTIAFASDIYARLATALERRVAAGDAPNGSSRPSTRLFVSSGSVPEGDTPAGAVTNAAFAFTSDEARAKERGETFAPIDQMRSDRKEGAFLASAEVDGHWVGVSKLVLTLAIAQGRDVLVTDVPEPIANRLRLICPDMVAATPRS